MEGRSTKRCEPMNFLPTDFSIIIISPTNLQILSGPTASTQCPPGMGWVKHVLV